MDEYEIRGADGSIEMVTNLPVILRLPTFRLMAAGFTIRTGKPHGKPRLRDMRQTTHGPAYLTDISDDGEFIRATYKYRD